MRFLTLFMLTAALTLTAKHEAAPPKIPANSKLFIVSMKGGLDGFIAAEIIKQKVSVLVVTEEAQADYILVGESLKEDDHWYNAVWGGKDKNEGNVRLLSVKDKTMVWAGEAGDRSLWLPGFKRGGERKVADRIVQQMRKDHLF